MRKFTDEFYGKLFLIAAVYNFIASLFFLGFPGFSAKLMLQVGALNDFYAHTFYNFTWGLVFVFGVGYFIVSLDVNKNHGVVVTGILGKLLFYFYFLYLFLNSKCTLFGMAGVSGDLLFSFLFGYFLYDKRK